VITNVIPDSVFQSNNLARLNIYDANGTNRGIIAINMTKSSPNDTPGKWTVTLTIADLSSAYGGAAGKQYVLMGQYDATGTTPTFTPSKLANNMNNTSKSDCFGLMIEGRDGLFSAVDWSDGPYLGYRPNNTSAFQVPVRITVALGGSPLPPAGYVDPAPGYVDNKLKLFYTDTAANILMHDMTATIRNNVLVKAELQGKAVPVVTAGVRPHSPTPIIDQGGEVRGLWMAMNANTSDSDMYFMPSLNPKDIPIKGYDTARWSNNGGVAGGTLFFVDSANYNIANSSEVAWILGSNTPLGGIATITLGCRNSKSSAPVTSYLALSMKVNAGTRSPVTIPGWNGSYALADPILILTTVVSTDKDERAHWSSSVPNRSSLKGQRIAIQALSLPGGISPTFTNTATLEFR